MGTHRLVSRCAGDVVGNSFFLGSSEIHPNLLATHKRLLCVDRVRYVWSGAICGLSVEYMWRVGRVFPAGCISIRITATLGYE
jgi:hypothetical protein